MKLTTKMIMILLVVVLNGVMERQITKFLSTQI